MKNKLLFIVAAVGLFQDVSATTDNGTELPFLQRRSVNLIAFPLFAATAYFCFDEASEGFDDVKKYVSKLYHYCNSRKPAWLTKATASLSKKTTRRKTREELWYKELDKQSYYLVGAIGTTMITWALNSYYPAAKSVLKIGEKG